jgi:2-polyprenyl-3-methyl-5-hydroxy-6-metoxy-1,4-benzoquinol methylase
MDASELHADILAREAEFFDRESAELDDASLVLPEDVINRYRYARPRPTNMPKDTLFTMIMPLDGKRVLDYGCGAGENSCLLAACGAHVTGFDISPVSVEKAKRRAELMGLANRTQFDVFPAGSTTYADKSFDIIIGFAILHHLHMILDDVYGEINRLLKPGGSVYFIEPVANNTVLRKLRRRVPVELVATPDERQLEYRELERVKQFGFGNVSFQHYRFMERLHRIIGDRRRKFLRRIDYHIERHFPFLRPMYGILLVIGQKATEQAGEFAQKAGELPPLS